jgi:5-formyltetrahydrofolate cyclo-ligase
MDTPADLKRWRKDLRAELITRRLASPAAQRAAWNDAIARLIGQGFPCLGKLVVGFCWPYRGEFDARPLARTLRERGARVALPAVIGKAEPLEFREWWPEAPMKDGVLGIPVPEGTPVLVPDAVLVPPVGFSDDGWRLGYGGGYFDRTLALIEPQPLKIVVAYELCRIPTIFPQAHDIPMDFVATEAGIHAVGSGPMARITPAEAEVRSGRIVGERGLPRPQRTS